MDLLGRLRRLLLRRGDLGGHRRRRRRWPALALVAALGGGGGRRGGRLGGGEVVLERLDGVVDELAARGAVPARPEAGVAVEAAAPDGRRVRAAAAAPRLRRVRAGAPLRVVRSAGALEAAVTRYASTCWSSGEGGGEREDGGGRRRSAARTGSPSPPPSGEGWILPPLPGLGHSDFMARVLAPPARCSNRRPGLGWFEGEKKRRGWRRWWALGEELNRERHSPHSFAFGNCTF